MRQRITALPRLPHRRALLALAALAVPATLLAFDINEEAPLKWPGATTTIFAGLPDTAATGVTFRQAVTEAARHWSESTPFDFQVSPQFRDPCTGLGDDAIPGQQPGDGFNGQGFADTVCGDNFGSSTLAVTIQFWEPNTLGAFDLVESDVIYNANRSFDIYDGPLTSGNEEFAGFDFRRMAWFQRLGAVGYTRVPVLRAAPGHGGGPVIRLARARLDLAAAIRARVPGQEGAVAAAILTGDRSAISDRTTEALRRANLSHLLAISGLHMGLLAGFVFWAARAALALVPALALRLPAKKVAAIAALCAGAGYLALSGASVATQRAFVMAAVMVAAVLADRRAITLRAVALAALIVLAMRPESLMTAGFQMSFAATTALVAAFGAVRETRLWRARAGPFRRVMALILSSAVAGAATAPFAAAHFNRIAEYGLVANLLAVPVMGAVVMPAAVVAGLAAPLGLAGLPLLAMQLGLGWILWVAGRIAALGGAVIPVPAPAPAVLALLSFGFLFFLLWHGRGRLAGIALAALALGLWVTGERPALLVAGSGRLIGVMTAEGRALSKPEGDGYTARLWLENDGDAAGQREAFARPGLKRAPGWTEARVAGTRFVLLSGRHWEEALGRACASGWVILPHPARTAPAPPGCRLIGTERLSEAGAMAIRAGTGGPRLITAADLAGRRPWAR